MRRQAILGVAMSVALVAAGRLDALDLGDSAPMGGVGMKDVSGQDVTLADAKGKRGLLVIFTCNHCPWAKAWEDRIVVLGNTYRQKGFGVVAVNSNDTAGYPEDGFEQMQARARQKGYEFPYVVDATSGVAKAFGATRTPEAYLFDGSGKLVYTGAVDDNAQDVDAVKQRYLKDALDAVIAGTPVPLPKTKALGCSIKLR